MGLLWRTMYYSLQTKLFVHSSPILMLFSKQQTIKENHQTSNIKQKYSYIPQKILLYFHYYYLDYVYPCYLQCNLLVECNTTVSTLTCINVQMCTNEKKITCSTKPHKFQNIAGASFIRDSCQLCCKKMKQNGGNFPGVQHFKMKRRQI